MKSRICEFEDCVNNPEHFEIETLGAHGRKQLRWGKLGTFTPNCEGCFHQSVCCRMKKRRKEGEEFTADLTREEDACHGL